MLGNNDQIAKRVIAIVAHNRGVKPSAIRLDSDLYKDLGLTGDDIADLFGELYQRLEIDFAGLNFGRHFTSEARHWFPGGHWKRQRIPVTIADLVAAAKSKKWMMNYESSEQ